MQVNMAAYVASNMDSVYKGARRIAKDPDAAADLVQTIYLAFKAANTSIELTNPNPWAYVYQSMYQRYHTDRNKNRDFLSETGTLTVKEVTEPVNLEHKLTLQTYMGLRPSANKRLIKNKILDLMLQDYSLAEIADKLKIDLGNVRSQRRYLILEFRKLIKRDYMLKGVA